MEEPNVKMILCPYHFNTSEFQQRKRFGNDNNDNIRMFKYQSPLHQMMNPPLQDMKIVKVFQSKEVKQKLDKYLTNNILIYKLSNGESLERKWLLHSPSKKFVFCCCGRLFNNSISTCHNLRSPNGYKGLKAYY